MASILIWGLDAAVYTLTLSLVVLGLGIVFGLLRVINLAHGEFLTLGAFGFLIGHDAGLGFVGGLVVGCVLAGIAGAAAQVAIVRPLQGEVLPVLLATFGLSLVIREVLTWKYGPAGHSVELDFPGQVQFAGESYPTYRFVIMGVSILALVALALFFARTRVGITARAVVENRTMAQVIGKRVGFMDTMMFALGTAMAGLAGAVLAPTLSVSPTMGQPYLVLSFLVVIFVGLERLSRNLFVLLVGAGVIGVLSSVLARAMDALVAQSVVLLLVVVLITFRPQGLLR